MKQNATNEFKDGLNLDLHPIVTPNTVLTDNLNGTFITYNGNEFCLQNDRGNKWVTNLTEGYTPIGIKEHNGVLYIVSVNGDKTEIGTFPSPIYPEVWPDDDSSQEAIDLYEKDKSLDDKNYRPLHILKNHAPLTNEVLGYDLQHPVTIEIQDSYDGSVNLILVDGEHKNRIINSGFSVLPNNQYKFVNRNQSVETNIYDNLDKESELIRTSSVLTNIDFLEVQSGGQFKGGNYTFYIKFGDADYNQTDVVAESGIVSIFNGNDGVPSTISGTLLDERTDKMIHLAITGLNHVYSKIYIYYSREYSDTQGFRMTEYGMFNEPIDMNISYMLETKDDSSGRPIYTEFPEGVQDIWLTGFEQIVPINSEELNVDYHTIDWARAEAQHSNMLFLGNVGSEETFKLYKELERLSKKLKVELNYSVSLSGTQYNYENEITTENNKPEYYSVKNIYNYVGYWPNELYRFGIVYILNDGSKTPVFNMNGGDFRSEHKRIKDNDKGVFFTIDHQILNSNNTVNPIGFKFSWPTNTIFPEKIKGWFVVRQKRIPNTICQGLSIAIDNKSKLPVTYYDDSWMTQSFLSSARVDNITTAMKPYLLYDPLLVDTDDENAESKWLKKLGYDNYWKYYDETDSEIPGVITIPIPENTDFPTTNSPNWGEELPTLFINLIRDSDRFNNIDYQIQLNSPFSVDIFGLDESTKLKISWDIWLNLKDQLNAIPVFAYRAYNNSDNILSPERYLLSSFVIDTPLLYNRIIRDSHDWDIYIMEKTLLHEQWELYPQLLNKEPTIIEEPGFNEYVSSGSLLSLDPIVVAFVRNTLDGSNFNVCDEYETTVSLDSTNSRVYNYEISNVTNSSDERSVISKAAFIPSNTNIKMLSNYGFSNVAGNSTDASIFKYFSLPHHIGLDSTGKIYHFENSEVNLNTNINLIRGLFTPFVGLTTDAKPLLIQSINLKDFRSNESRETDASVRIQDNSEYYTVSDYFELNNDEHLIYRGDCFTNTVSIRMLRNFIDTTVPDSEIILDEESWWKWVTSKDKDATEDQYRVQYDQVNLADVNTVALGYWVTFKCLSSYNLGLRSVDRFHEDEQALLGSYRSFYPLNGASTATGNKMEESSLLNDGLSATVGRKRYNLMPDVPYSKSEFANRIMFSNINVTDAFTNGYRTFQGLAYKDYDKQYGAITKLISLGQNIFVVMEHGLGLVPVNPKALMQTTTGETIHIYGYGVLPDEMTIISQDYGSKYEHSVVHTPIGIYGIDVDAKKIWRFSDKQGFETISDMKIETYLKDNLKSQEIEMGNSDIRTHYNGKKGDLMFTWYCNGEIYSICYNERQNIWVTRYDWTPIVSENINDEFYSLNIRNEDSDYSIWDHHYEVGKENNYISTWYDQEHGFEFEFIVSDPIGVNKIFENLQIISNNVSPKELQITIVGDDYTFKRDEITPSYEREEYPTNTTWTTSNIHKDKEYRELEDTIYKWDWRLHQKAIVKTQTLCDIYKHGRRLGNMQYKNGMWFIQIDPLRFDIEPLKQQKKEVRIRDKWAKIRIRYSGENLAIITAIKTLINI